MQLSKKRQQDYFRERWENFLHHFEQFAKRTNAEDLHRVRVELKKIRALLFIQKEVHDEPYKRASALLKKVFRLGGKIREAQVNAQLVKHAGAGSVEFFTAHRNTVAKQSKAFIQFVRRNPDKLITVNTKVWKSLRRVSSSAIRKLNKKLLEEIRSAYFPRMKVSALHEARKLIKRMVYMHGMLRKADAEKLTVPIEQLRKLEEETGKWHDVIIAKELVRKFPRAAKAKRMLEQKRKVHLGRIKQLAAQTFAVKKV